MSLLWSAIHLSPSWWPGKRFSTLRELRHTYPKLMSMLHFLASVVAFPGQPSSTGSSENPMHVVWPEVKCLPKEGAHFFLLIAQTECKNIAHLLPGNAPNLLLNLFRFCDQKCIFKGCPMRVRTHGIPGHKPECMTLWAYLAISHFITIQIKWTATLYVMGLGWGGGRETHRGKQYLIVAMW